MNWAYSEDQAVVDLTDTLDESKILASDMLVMAEGGEAELSAESTMSSYFAAVRLSRQEARDSAVSLLQEAMAYDTEAQTSATGEKLESLVNDALCEAQIESLVIAKGYTDCVAYISENGISVAVASPEGGLQKQDVALIADVVLSQSDYKMEDIHVVEVQ